MAQTVREVMTKDPVTIEAEETVTELARRMREADAGAIVVLENGTVSGIATDRDIVVRVVAEEKAPKDTRVAEFFTRDVTTVGPDTSVDQAIDLMRTQAIRRLPVVEGGRAVGIVSLGDLAIEGEGERALADISAAPSNN